MLDDVGQWLKSFGLREYAEAFAENAVTFDLLNKLTEQDLKELGVSKLGHRKRLLEAIATLSRPGEEAVEAIPQESTPSRAEAERRQLTVMFCDLVDSMRTPEQ